MKSSGYQSHDKNCAKGKPARMRLLRLPMDVFLFVFYRLAVAYRLFIALMFSLVLYYRYRVVFRRLRSVTSGWWMQRNLLRYELVTLHEIARSLFHVAYRPTFTRQWRRRYPVEPHGVFRQLNVSRRLRAIQIDEHELRLACEIEQFRVLALPLALLSGIQKSQSIVTLPDAAS